MPFPMNLLMKHSMKAITDWPSERIKHYALLCLKKIGRMSYTRDRLCTLIRVHSDLAFCL